MCSNGTLWILRPDLRQRISRIVPVLSSGIHSIRSRIRGRHIQCLCQDYLYRTLRFPKGAADKFRTPGTARTIPLVSKEGMHPQQACEKAVHDFDLELKRRRGKAGDMSLIAMNNKGEWGCATNIEGFSFVVATEKQAPTVYLVNHDKDGKCTFEVASKEWMDNYMATRTAPLVRK